MRHKAYATSAKVSGLYPLVKAFSVELLAVHIIRYFLVCFRLQAFLTSVP